MLIVWLVAVPLSHTIARNEKDVDASLISPFMRWLLPRRKGHHVEMKAIVLPNGKQRKGSFARETVVETTYAER